MASHALARYYSILEGRSRPNYLVAKQIRVDVGLSSPTEALWAAHDGAGPDDETREGVTLLQLKAEIARRMLSACVMCERRCGADRASGQEGHCGVLESRVSSEFLHVGEEPDLVPSHTIFFAGCTLDCVFCQNWDISTSPEGGRFMPPPDLARVIESRARGGFVGASPRNVNWVGGDPTPNLAYVLEVLEECSANIPQVWNSNMYMSEESMKLLDGVVDIHLTDFKYGNDRCALRLSNATDYIRVVERNHALAGSQAEMIIRHLVLPGHTECCTRPVLSWIASNLRDVKVNVMAQYRPEHMAKDFPDISRRLRPSEYEEAVRIATELGLDLVE